MTALIAIAKACWKPLTIILLVAFLLLRSYSAGYDSADTAWRLQWAQRDLADSTAALHRDVSERAEEQRRQKAVSEEAKRVNDELAKVQANADAAKHAADGLQRQLTQLQRQLGRSETGRLSAVVASNQAKTEASVLLAQLLSESDNLAGKYAEEADRNYVTGSSCERTYNKVTQP